MYMVGGHREIKMVILNILSTVIMIINIIVMRKNAYVNICLYNIYKYIDGLSFGVLRRDSKDSLK